MNILLSLLMTIQTNFSHASDTSEITIKHKIEMRGDLPHATVEKQLKVYDALQEFPLGKFLLERGGLNGYWTYFIVSDPEHKKKRTNTLEAFILERAPIVLAMQQRFNTFKKELQKRVVHGGSFASIPCGLMADLLDLDYSLATNFTLTGIDLDQESLDQAKQCAAKKNLSDHCCFTAQDAWDLPYENTFDLIESNGLNFYVQDDAKVVALYRQFNRALKPGGCLIVSFLTTPAEWLPTQIDPEDMQLQRIIFVDIINSKWRTFRSVETTTAQLKEAGFAIEEL